MQTTFFRISATAVLALAAFLPPSRPVVAQTASGPPVVTIVATDHHAAEAETDAGTFTVSRSGGTDAPLLVFYRLSGTASNGIDYLEIPNTITILAGASSATITIKPINDTLSEGTETVVATLGPSPTASPIEPYRVGFPNSDIVLLTDNDSPETNRPPHVVLIIEATDARASEIAAVPPGLGMPQGYDAGKFVVSRTGNVSEPLEVRYEVGGTAKNGIDYAQLSGSVTIPAGSATAEIQAGPIDDGEVEGTESVLLALKASDCDPALPPTPGCYTLGDRRQATVIIEDNDTTPHLPPAVGIIHPVEDAMFTAPADIELVATAQGTGAWIRMVEFFAGDRRLGSVEFHVFLDSFRLAWSDVPAGEYTLTAKATDSLGATAWSGPVHITVKPAGVQPLVLVPEGGPWKYLDDGSDQGTSWRTPGFNDTEWPSGPAQLGFGDSDEATLLRRGEGDRGFITYYFRRAFEVANAAGISELTLRLLRDDGAVVYLNGMEVFRSNMPDGPIQFNTPAASTVGGDAESILHVAVISPHVLVEGRNVLAVEVHQSAVGSSDLSFDMELIASARSQIPVVNIETIDPEAAEISPLLDVPPNPAVFKVTRSGETTGSLRVYYRLTGTAKNGVDYQELSGLLTIPAGASSAEIVVQPLDDQLVEGTESVVATLVPLFSVDPPAGTDPYIVGPKASAEAHIRDNDVPPPNALPLVRIARPESGSTFEAPAAISVVVEVRDPDGWVGLVEFFANERKIGEQSVVFVREPDPGQTQIFSFEWKDVPPGEYTLVAKAADNRDGRGVSEPARINVRDCGLETVLLPRATGTVRRFPEMGILEGAPVANDTDDIQSAYFRTTELNREFRRGFLEFAMPVVEGSILRARLILTEDRATISNPVPPDMHQLAFYPADLVIDTNDYSRPVTLITTFATDPNEVEHKTFSFDVTALANEFKGRDLGFRIKLAVDPEYNVDGFLGSGFQTGSQASPARIVLVTCARPQPIVPLVTVVARDAYAREGTNDLGELNTAAFVVRRTGETNSDLTVFYSLHGTAENGKDYETLPASVIIPAGRHTARVVVRPIDDELKECIETVVLRLEPDPSLGPVAPYTVGRPNKAAAIIVDNDQPRPHCVRLPDGLFHLCLPGNNGFGFRLECSTDLKHWEPLCTNVVTDGAIHFVDPDANGDQHRFYRIVSESAIELDD